MFALRTALARAPSVVARNVARRHASTHATPSASSDMPWIIGSIAFTVPAAGYLLTSGGGGAAHADEHHTPKETIRETIANTPTSISEAKETASSAMDSAKSMASSAVNTVKSTTAGDVKEKAGEVSDQAAEKAGDVKEVAAEKAQQAKESIPEHPVDAAKDAVTPNEKPAEANPAKRDPAHARKPIEKGPSSGTMSGKQEGLSNTDTVHTLLNTERGDAIAKKSEGVHETSKLKGTVDVSSPDKQKANENVSASTPKDSRA